MKKTTLTLSIDCCEYKITIPNVDADIYKMLEMFKGLLLASEYHPNSVDCIQYVEKD